MNATLHHEFDLIATLITIGAVWFCVLATVLILRAFKHLECWWIDRRLSRQADEILARVGNVPRGFGHHGSSSNRLGVPLDWMAKKEG